MSNYFWNRDTLRAVAAFVYSDTKAWQWPHQGAKNSTIHTSSPLITSLSKFEGVNSITLKLEGYRAHELVNKAIRTEKNLFILT